MKNFFLTFACLLFATFSTVSQTYVMSREQLRDVIDPLNLRSSQLMTLATNGVVLSYRAEAGSAASDTAAVFNSTKRAGYKWVLENWNGDIRAFGVKADGVTDDTVATQAAIDYTSANGLPLMLPGGYKTSIVAGLIVGDDSTIQGPDFMKSISANIVANEQNKWIWRLKDNANTWVIKYTNGQHTLRGVTIDGNKDNNTNDVPALYIDIGFASYRECFWEDIGVFNSAGDGIYNRAHSPTFNRIMSQNNVGSGIVIMNGYDSMIVDSYFGGNGRYGMRTIDHGSARWERVDSFQNYWDGIRMLNPYLGYFDKIVCNNNLRNGWVMETKPSTNYTLPPYTGNFTYGGVGLFTISGAQVNNSNWYLNKSGLPTTEADGTYANFLVEGTGAVFPYTVMDTLFYFTENLSTTRPLYLMQSDASGYPDFQNANFVNCNYTTNSDYFRSNAISGTSLTTASFTRFKEATTSKEYNFWPLGNLSVGGAGLTGLPLNIGQTGSEMIDMTRTGINQKWRIGVGFRSLIFTEETSSFKGIAFENNGTPTIYLGTISAGGSAPYSGAIKAESATSGTNSPGANLGLYAGSGTGGSYINGSINFYTPDVILDGAKSPLTNAVVQTNTLRMQILNDGSLYIPVRPQPVNDTGGKFYYGTNSESPGVTNWWFSRPNGTTNKWVGLP